MLTFSITGLRHRWAPAAVLCLLAAAGAPSSAQGQSSPYTVQIGSGDPSLSVMPGATISLPVVASFPAGKGLNVAAIQAMVRWNRAALTFVSAKAADGSGLTVTVNASTADSGMVRFNGFRTAGLRTSSPLIMLTFKAAMAPARSVMALSVEAMGDENGTPIRPVTPRAPLMVCVGETTSCR